MKKLIFILLAFATSAMAQQYRTRLVAKDSGSAYYESLRSGLLTGNDTNIVTPIGGGQGMIRAFQRIHAVGTYTVPTAASLELDDTLLAAAKLDTIKLDSISHYTNGYPYIGVNDISGLNSDSVVVLPAGSDKINFATGSVVAIKGATATFGHYHLTLDVNKKSWITIP